MCGDCEQVMCNCSINVDMKAIKKGSIVHFKNGGKEKVRNIRYIESNTTFNIKINYESFHSDVLPNNDTSSDYSGMVYSKRGSIGSFWTGDICGLNIVKIENPVVKFNTDDCDYKNTYSFKNTNTFSYRFLKWDNTRDVYVFSKMDKGIHQLYIGFSRNLVNELIQVEDTK